MEDSMEREVWMVEWENDYNDMNAAFSTRDKAIHHIEEQARRLHFRDFELIGESSKEHGEPWWGVYSFFPTVEERDEPLHVSYQLYKIDYEP